jgi:3',5'-cyclic AMP phosphodiesterase CpdA
MRLVHVTDLHFGAEDLDVVAALRTDLAAQDVDRVLVSGDLTMRARAGQFRAARALLDSFGPPWTSVPANHDVPLNRVLTRVFRPLEAYRRFVDAQPQPLVRVLMVHHPVFRSGQRPHETLVRGAEQTLQAAPRAGVDVVLRGHDHVQAQIDLSLTRSDLRCRLVRRC